MMSMTLETARTLAREGRYVELASSCGPPHAALRLPSSEHRLLLAHALLHVGDMQRALAIASIENTRQAPAAIRSQCEIITGLTCRRNADSTGARHHLQLAVHLAKDSADPRQIAWASLQLFRLLAELQPREASGALLREVRMHVTRAGDPHVTAYMHDALSLMEASAGSLEEARRHLAIAASIVDRHPNAWLQQVALVGAAYLDYFESRYHEAIQKLRAARGLIPVAGALLATVIDCNEGHALIATGQFDEAIERLQEVSSSGLALFTLGALDGLARVYLATGRLDQCDDVLRQIDTLGRDDQSASSALGSRWTAVTRTQLLLRRGLPGEALRVLTSHLRRAAHLEDRLLEAALLSLNLDAHASHRTGRPGLAQALMDAAEATSGVPEQQGGYYRAVAAALDGIDDRVAELCSARAHAIWEDQGNRCAPLELPQATTPHRRTSSPPPPSELAGPVVANCIGGVFRVGFSSKLLGRELIGAIDALRCSPGARVVTGPIGSASAASTEGRCLLPLGEHRGRPLTLVCTVPHDPAKAAMLADLLRIGRAALALVDYRAQERARAALWPANAVEGQTDALFLSEEMQSLLSMAKRIAFTSVPVLITGETGTGKEVLARTIHACSARARAPFLPFNCTSTSKEMLDSQLFGHRRGAFTGATDHYPGVIRTAAGGTLFLDEIGEMSLDVQPKLLRFLESGEVHPVGQAQPLRVDVRIIAATNADLDTLMAQNRFREDLFYRLHIVRLHVPPLRERRVEIPTLANHYLHKYGEEWHKGELRLAEETMEYLVLYRWPGNVRQLANEMRRMAALAEPGAVLMPEHLSSEIAASRRTIPPSERRLDPIELAVRVDQPMAAAVEHLERTMVQYALDRCGGRVEEAASLLGLSRKGLYLKRQRFGLLADGHKASDTRLDA